MFSHTLTATHPDPPKGTVSLIHRLTHKQLWSPYIHTTPHAHLQYALKTFSWGRPANSLWGSEEESDPSVDWGSAGLHTAPQPPLGLQSSPAPHPVPQNIQSHGLGKETNSEHLLYAGHFIATDAFNPSKIEKDTEAQRKETFPHGHTARKWHGLDLNQLCLTPKWRVSFIAVGLKENVRDGGPISGRRDQAIEMVGRGCSLP